VEGSQYCQYALNVLASILEGFPIKPKGVGYSNDEIVMARQWMESHDQYSIKR
jgi:hypothetical protein